MKITERFQPATLEALGTILVGALITSPVVFAQGKDTRESSGAKSVSSQPGSNQQIEHHALTRAQQSGMSQAQAAAQYVDANKAKLDRNVLNRYTESIGRALDEAQQERQLLERGLPEDSSLRDDFDSVRDHQQAAAEHYRSFVQEVAKTKPEADDLADEARDISDELKEAEAAHKKTFSVQTSPEKDTEKTAKPKLYPYQSPRGATDSDVQGR